MVPARDRADALDRCLAGLRAGAPTSVPAGATAAGAAPTGAPAGEAPRGRSDGGRSDGGRSDGGRSDGGRRPPERRRAAARRGRRRLPRPRGGRGGRRQARCRAGGPTGQRRPGGGPQHRPRGGDDAAGRVRRLGLPAAARLAGRPAAGARGRHRDRRSAGGRRRRRGAAGAVRDDRRPAGPRRRGRAGRRRHPGRLPAGRGAAVPPGRARRRLRRGDAGRRGRRPGLAGRRAGHPVRYEPRVVAGTRPAPRSSDWFAQRAGYGRGGAALAAGTPAGSPRWWSAAGRYPRWPAWRPQARLGRRLHGAGRGRPRGPGCRRPRAGRGRPVRLTAEGLGWTLLGLAEAAARPWLPAMLAASTVIPHCPARHRGRARRPAGRTRHGRPAAAPGSPGPRCG